MCVPPEKFLVKMGGGGMAIRRQLPLRLAWAISVHKSQVYNIYLHSQSILQKHHAQSTYHIECLSFLQSIANSAGI